MHNFRELKVWHKSVEVATIVYKVTKEFPKNELYGIVSQMRRAAVSIASNIAEGAGRGSVAEFSHFLDIARGSSFELETQLLIARRLDYIEDQQTSLLKNEIIEIEKMLSGLKRSLQ